jgi:hypothetical protein
MYKSAMEKFGERTVIAGAAAVFFGVIGLFNAVPLTAALIGAGFVTVLLYAGDVYATYKAVRALYA